MSNNGALSALQAIWTNSVGVVLLLRSGGWFLGHLTLRERASGTIKLPDTQQHSKRKNASLDVFPRGSVKERNSPSWTNEVRAVLCLPSVFRVVMY